MIERLAALKLRRDERWGIQVNHDRDDYPCEGCVHLVPGDGYREIDLCMPRELNDHDYPCPDLPNKHK